MRDLVCCVLVCLCCGACGMCVCICMFRLRVVVCGGACSSLFCVVRVVFVVSFCCVVIVLWCGVVWLSRVCGVVLWWRVVACAGVVVLRVLVWCVCRGCCVDMCDFVMM